MNRPLVSLHGAADAGTVAIEASEKAKSTDFGMVSRHCSLGIGRYQLSDGSGNDSVSAGACQSYEASNIAGY